MPERVGVLRRSLLRALAARFEAGSGRPFLQLLALTVIDREGIRTQIALSERLMADPPTVNRLIARLERDGLVTRTRGKDRRTVVLSVTRAGKQEVKGFLQAVDDVDREVREALGTADYDALLRLMERADRALRRR